MRYGLALVMAVALLAASPAFAQQPGAFGPTEGQWELTLGGTGNNDRKFDVGQFGLNADLGYYMTQAWSLGGRQDVVWAGGEGRSDVWSGATRIYTNYHFDLDQWRPFLGFNLGYVYGDGVRDSWTAGPEGGLKWYVKEETFIYGRVGYDFEFRKARQIDDSFRRGTFVYNIGVGFNF